MQTDNTDSVSDSYGPKIDQGIAAAYDLGRIAASYYKALADAGIPPAQAGQITATYVASSNARRKQH